MRVLNLLSIILVMCFFCMFNRQVHSSLIEFKSIRIPTTGQMRSYRFRDDGDLRRGVKWPNPRFVDNHNGTITDRLTGLMWEKAPSDKKLSWDDAFNRIAEVNRKKLGGHSDWRLPNILELRSLANMRKRKSRRYIYLKEVGFIFSRPSLFWSSTTVFDKISYAYSFHARSGSLSRFLKVDSSLSLHGAIAVRGGFK